MRLDSYKIFPIKKVFVIFEDNTTLWWLRFFRRGFRHCYVLLPFQGGVLELNPMSNQLHIVHHQNIDIHRLIFFLKQNPLTTVEKITITNLSLKCAPLGIFTCVEFIKRLIGIHSFFTLTPYALFKKIHK